MFTAKGKEQTLSPFYVGPKIGIDGGNSVGVADAIGFDSTQFELYPAPTGTFDGGQVTGFVGVRIKSAPVIGSLQLGGSPQPTNDPIIGIANPGAVKSIITVETSGNDIDVIKYDPNSGSPLLLVGGGTPMLQSITIEAETEIKIKAAPVEVKLEKTPGRVSIVGGPLRLPSSTVAGLPNAATMGAGSMYFVTNESGGAVPAFSDGTDWRRATDRAIVS